MTTLPENMLGLVARPPAPPEALLVEGFGRVVVFAADASLQHQRRPFNRALAEWLVEALIARMDAEDGDPDVELNGDEEDSGSAEDDFAIHVYAGFDAWAGPGCVISDPDCAVDDFGCDEDTDMEREGSTGVGDVPNCHLFALEPDPVTGERACLGMSNPSENFVGRIPGNA